MNKKLLIMLVTLGLTLALGLSASASSIQRINIGYLNMNLTCVDNHSAKMVGLEPENSEVSDHFFYFESANLFSIDAVDNLYWGVKTAGAFNNTKLGDVDGYKNSASVSSASISALIEYNIEIYDQITVGLGANLGANVLNLSTRSYDPDNATLDEPATYHSVWKPYVMIGAYIAVDYYFNPIVSANLVGGYNYSIGITNWIDGFNVLDEDFGAQKNISAFYVSLGLGVKF